MPERIGPYRVDELLGRGGMGEVYRAYDEKLERSVAIKLVRARGLGRDSLRRFRREARTAARLSHPAIVQIYHVEEVGGDECIVMELVEGRPLSQLVAEGPLETGPCLSLARQIAAGLAEAHAKHVVHRDLKTENVMLTADGRVKILDFGLARPLLPSPADSRSGDLAGTPRSMSPEQANELPVDARSDLFSFGTLLYEIATGQTPFRGRTPIAVLHQVCHHRPPPARALNPDVPAELSSLIARLMEKRPADRPQTAGEVLEALEAMPAVSRPRAGAARVARPPRLHDERRQVTLLGCALFRPGEEDESGPDGLSVIAPGFLNAASEIVQHHLGMIAEVTGDGLVACFGFPRAHEDDAGRATAAALRVADMFRSELRADPALRLPVALHTGMADVSRTDGVPRHERLRRHGALWARSAELRSRVPPDDVWVSSVTHRLIHASFRCDGPHPAAGLDAPLYRVHGAVERRGAAPRVDPHSLVARREELELLQDRWQLAREGRGQVVLVGGDAGIGKTRLLAACAEQLGLAPGQWWGCRSLPEFQASPLRAAVALLWQMLGTERGAPREDQRARLEEHLRRYGLQRHAPCLAALLGLPALEDAPFRDPRQRMFEAIVELLLASAAERPRVWMIEDLHWADPSSLDLLDLLVDQVPTARLMLLLSCRPRFRSRWEARSYLTPMVLSALNHEQSRALIRRRAGGRLPEPLEDQIVELTDGVPLFVEELTQLVLESDAVRRRDGRYELQRPGQQLSIPTTLRGALTARLDRLGSAQQIAQLAAVFGRELAYDALLAVSPVDRETLDRELARLVEAELLYRRGVTDVRFLFKHALIRQAAYESLPEGERRRYHARIARALEVELPDTARLHPELVARHYTAAGQTERAAALWLEAGRRAWASVEASQHLRRGLRLLAELPESPERRRLEQELQETLGSVRTAKKR